ncbi:hypothetical protein [Pseudomonas rhodesiae]|uniref:hypothetical protein n=1 Tax=Pseudomonas rhodesiae TaxID=76760 RepID=UPI0012B6FD73|nr:hypothetical protein [Pseudomonas rhodesiae]
MTALVFDFNQAIVLREAIQLGCALQRLTLLVNKLFSVGLIEEARLLDAHANTLRITLLELKRFSIEQLTVTD